MAVLRNGFNVGDSNRNGLLDKSETWLYTSVGAYATATAPGVYQNVVLAKGIDVVTGQTSVDDDLANFRVTQLLGDGGRMTGGGSVFTTDGMRVTHGFTIHGNLTTASNLQVSFEGNSFHMEQLTFVTTFDDPVLNHLPRAATFDTLIGEGVGRFNNKAGHTVKFTFTDAGEPGKSDFAQIEIRDPAGRVVLLVADRLNNGNHQAHPETQVSQLLAAAPAPLAVAAPRVLVADDVAPLLAQARAAWAPSLSGEQSATLAGLRIEVADLPGQLLGQVEGGVLTLDTDAAGWGWFIDPTPQDASEFRAIGGDLLAKGGPAAGRMDLMSVLTHELGHAAGFEHADDGVMTPSLEAGLRLPMPGVPGMAQGMPAEVTELVAPMSASPSNGLHIDWSSGSRPIAKEGDVPELTNWQAVGNWQQRFVNHLGASAERMQPNAGLRLHLPVAAEVAPRVIRL